MLRERKEAYQVAGTPVDRVSSSDAYLPVTTSSKFAK